MLSVRDARPFRFTLAMALIAAAVPSSAQSVQVFGTLDLNVTHARVGDTSATVVDQGGITPSRLGFRGTEDLGGGLRASFWLESALLPDTGGVMGAFFGRRSTVSLAGNQWGELRLGRDYTPNFWNVTRYSPFGNNGVAAHSNILSGWPFGIEHGPGPGNPTRGTPLVRLDNSIGYHLPSNLGGVFGQVMVSLSENAVGAKYVGARLGYAAGGLEVAGAYGSTKLAGLGHHRVTTLGGTYQAGIAKLYANVLHQRVPDRKSTTVLLGTGIAVGLGEIKLTVARANESGVGVDADDATMVGLGYQHRLSKRTSLYAFASHLSNRGNAEYTTGFGPASVAGANAKGYQVGVLHDF